MLQFQEVSAPQPEIWSPIVLPTRPVKKPTIGPKAYRRTDQPNAGRTHDACVPGIGIWMTSKMP